MTGKYWTGESALWSTSAQSAVLEMIYKGGSISSIEYASMFLAKDKRRIEFLVAAFYKTYILTEARVYDCFEDNGEPPQQLLEMMPTFRKSIKDLAAAKDAELGPDVAAKLPHGPYTVRVGKALPEMPDALAALHELVLPVDKSFTPVEDSAPSGRSPRQKRELFEKIHEKARQFVHYCQHNDLVTTEDVAKATTESVVKWCGQLKRCADKQYEISDYEYQTNKRRKTNEADDEKKQVLEEAFLEKHCKKAFPHAEEIRKQHAAMLLVRSG